MLYYVPLEPYKERYTMQLSAPIKGWYERNWIKNGVNYTRIDPTDKVNTSPKTIEIGQVLDPIKRTSWCFSQIRILMQLAKEGKLSDDDTIFFDDFWTPGIEALFYLFDQIGLKPKMYAYCWAQSVDEWDFTWKMRSWMRPMEKAIAEKLTGVFVANTLLRDLLDSADVAYYPKVHVVGLPFDSSEVRMRMPLWYQLDKPFASTSGDTFRLNEVVFSSRLDVEKDPKFFLAVAKKYYQIDPHVTFRICTSSAELRSNDQSILDMIHCHWKNTPNLIVSTNLTKEAYYNILCQAKIQFNCALQDWVSFTLLEATTAGCYPIYPRYRSFPETFDYEDRYLYQQGNVTEAVEKIRSIVLRTDLWTPEAIKSRSWIYKRFDSTWLRMLDIMSIQPTLVTEDYSSALAEILRNPYSAELKRVWTD